MKADAFGFGLKLDALAFNFVAGTAEFVGLAGVVVVAPEPDPPAA